MTGGGPRYLRRRLVERAMFAAAILATAVTVGILLLILGYLVWQGGSTISWSYALSRMRIFWLATWFLRRLAGAT